MTKIIQKVIAYYHKHGLVDTFHQIFIDDYKVFSRLPPEKYADALKKWYKRQTGKPLDL